MTGLSRLGTQWPGYTRHADDDVSWPPRPFRRDEILPPTDRSLERITIIIIVTVVVLESPLPSLQMRVDHQQEASYSSII